jgi:hypothetical protein
VPSNHKPIKSSSSLPVEIVGAVPPGHNTEAGHTNVRGVAPCIILTIYEAPALPLDNVIVTLPEADPKSNICDAPVSKSNVAVVPEGVAVGTLA